MGGDTSYSVDLRAFDDCVYIRRGVRNSSKQHNRIEKCRIGVRSESRARRRERSITAEMRRQRNIRRVIQNAARCAVNLVEKKEHEIENRHNRNYDVLYMDEKSQYLLDDQSQIPEPYYKYENCDLDMPIVNMVIVKAFNQRTLLYDHYFFTPNLLNENEDFFPDQITTSISQNPK